MQFIKEWTMGLVIISSVAAVVFLLAPAGKFEKTLRTSVSIVLLVVMLKPFIILKTPEVLMNDFYTEYETTPVAGEDMVKHFRDILENKILNTLSDAGYILNDVKSEIIINNENEVSIKSVTLFITEEESKNSDLISEIIENEYGIIAQIEVMD